ncbi:MULTISPECIES: cupin domain-containing protein [unclassified Microbacterium]|uniref:cupin domain-containing protein n=1 Tax=unclassified Microbacterium TaxID=2609290 RepID=UPI001AD56F2F|nr:MULTISPECIES: cupin domain-containing protein [unclassified Microbacterium]MBN9157759.1 cupin domain-containing protein [Microbacterium sp.]MBS1900888.1 cupin domain-containing protein [Actinomycetota bacterium]
MTRAPADLGRLVHNAHEIGFTDLAKTGLKGQQDQGQVCTLISRDLSGSDDLNVSLGRILPGQHHLCHHHPDASEFYVVVSGTPLVHLDGSEHRARPGDGIYIPRGTVHGITNDTGEIVELVVGMSKPADWEFVSDE